MKPQKIFIDWSYLKNLFEGKTVAVVGSAPSVLNNAPGFIDSHDIVVRVNNYKLSINAGYKTDVHYSFYGQSIKKSRRDLIGDGVGLCFCKCPNDKIMSSRWHVKRFKGVGVDYRYIYIRRKDFWFCPTFIPDKQYYMDKFELLGKRSPTTGFSAIYDVLQLNPKSIYLTGFDFFRSGVHNVDERWNPGDQSDPIRHDPEAESAWIKQHKHLFTMDETLRRIVNDD